MTMLPKIDHHIDQLTQEVEDELREAQSVWTPRLDFGKRIARERERFQRLFYSNGKAWVCSSSPSWEHQDA